MLKIIFLCLTLPILITAQLPVSSEPYPNKLSLSNSYTIFWKHDDYIIQFEIHYRRALWALFGIKSDLFSDVVVGWLNPNKIGHFSDRKLTLQNTLEFDSETNWMPLDAFFSNNYTVLKFKRNIKLNCNNVSSTEDLDINIGRMKIIFATGNQTKNDEDILFKNVNQTQVNLLVDTNGPFKCPLVRPEPILASKPTSNYDHDLDLKPGVFKLYWNYTNTDIIAEIHCKTDGWVSFGFSPNGGMDKSDVIVGWISNGKVNFTDRHIRERQVLIDKNQDWILLFSSENNGINIFKFTRKIILCDSDDITIDQGSPYIIFAYGTTDPMPGQDISYHGMNRGGKIVSFISSPKQKDSSIISDTEILDSSIRNVILPKEDTYYYCKGFRVPKEFTQKRHIYKWELILPKMDTERMHHALIYECSKDYNGSEPFKSGFCYKNPIKMQYCQSITFGWAYGGRNIEIFPKDMGYPIGGDTDFSFFVLEVHYDNPEKKFAFFDKLIWRYYLTKNLREKELGILTLGTASSSFGIAIPPGVEYFPIKTSCPNECTKNLFKNNLTIISAIPHTHLTGIEVWTKIIRNGNDIGYLFNNKHYNFNYQNSYPLNPYVNITSEDELITQCVYRTLDRNQFVLGGLSTRDEMCLHFLTYYPRKNDFKSCFSVPYIEDYGKVLYELNRTGNAFVSSFGTTYQSFILTLDQTFERIKTNQYVKDLFVNFYKTSRFNGICSSKITGPHNQTVPKNIFTEKNLCEFQNLPDQGNNLFQYVLINLRQILNSILQYIQSLLKNSN